MSKEKFTNWIKQPVFWLGLIFLTGSVVRLAALNQFPSGLHQDEAYSAYNAYSIMNYGIDSYGYTRPVYYTVWGSGMSIQYLACRIVFRADTLLLRYYLAVSSCFPFVMSSFLPQAHTI